MYIPPKRGTGPFVLKYTRGPHGFTLLESRHGTLEAAIREAFDLFNNRNCNPVEISGQGRILMVEDIRDSWKELGLVNFDMDDLE